MHRTGHHIAQFNWGILAYDWDDPRVADFVNGVALVNGAAERADGFVWRMSDADMEAAQQDTAGSLGGNPRLASTLSVWRDVDALQAFVWNTVHRQFYNRKAEWYDPQPGPRLALWWVPKGHVPDIAEASARRHHLETHGPSDAVFGWAEVAPQGEWRHKQCGKVAS
ncbi:MAG: DUF3291 domain-containing protein [Paracoccaceae bacterium]